MNFFYTFINFIGNIVNIPPNERKIFRTRFIYEYPVIIRSNDFFSIINFFITTFGTLMDISGYCLNTCSFYF